MKLSIFFNSDYVDQASYDNLRKIASVVDGQKNASRKILHTIIRKNIKTKIKVSQLGPKIAEFSEYLHGSLEGVVCNLAQDYAGTNNIPLLQKKGNFGTRFSHEPSAARYISTYGTDTFFELFKTSDIPVLKKQFFEGNEIEPMFFVPGLPILLINGAEGVSSGFAQKILARNPQEIKKYIFNEISKKKIKCDLTPWFRDFNGTIRNGERPNQWKIYGSCERVKANLVIIKDIPVNYDLKGYLKVLDNLEDDKTISSYKDCSEDDIFLFEVRIPSTNLKGWDEETLYKKLKLIKTVSENYTVMDEKNKIKVYESCEEILDHYIRVKLEYLRLRKDNHSSRIADEIDYLNSKYEFIKAITEETLTINKRKKKDIILDLDNIDGIIVKEESYDYLLNMNILSLTEERMIVLKQEIQKKEKELETLKKSSIEQIWTKEIKDI